MSDEDDYLSDKFVVNSTAQPSGTKTYSQIRKDAQKRAQYTNEQSRKRGQKEIREEALNKSLFERAQEESGGNKALMMMIKMGFKPGQSLGKVDEANSSNKASVRAAGKHDDLVSTTTITTQNGHRTEPIPLNEWSGRQGIGTCKKLKLKRGAPSTSEERVAKMAKMEKEAVKAQDDFRVRSRLEYLERQAEGRLGPAQRTCVNLDEKAGRKFNVLWLNPGNPDSCTLGQESQSEDSATREMPQNVLDEASQFLRLQAQDRLELVLTHLRDEYAYCFWCGTEYEDQEEMEEKCPGVDEESHD